MARFNPYLLLGDELSYEALLRGLPSEGTVRSLRHTLKGSQQDIPINLDNLTKLDISKEVNLCAGKFYEIKSITENISEETSPVNVLRVTQRIEHLTRRVKNLHSWPNVDTQTLPETTSHLIETCLMQLPEFSRKIRRHSDTFSPEIIRQALLNLQSETPTPVVSPVLSDLASSIPIILEPTEQTLQTTTSPVTTTTKTSLTVTSVPPTSINTLTSQFSQSNLNPPNMLTNVTTTTANSMYNLTQLPSYSHIGQVQNQTSHNTMSINTLPASQQYNSLYGKITHPIERYLSEVPCTDGLNLGLLWQFLQVILKLKNIPQLSHFQTLELLLTYARPPLSHRIQEAITFNHSIDQLHGTLLKFFIPTRLYEQLKLERVHRVQGHNERLATYISEVREAANILRVNATEKEVVESILIGLCPTERSRLALMNRPNSFYELEQLCIHSSNVWHSDRLRGNETIRNPIVRSSQTRPQYTQNVQNFRPQQHFRFPHNQSTPRPNMTFQRQRQPNPTHCYNCGSQNHTQRDCPRANNTGPKNE